MTKIPNQSMCNSPYPLNRRMFSWNPVVFVLMVLAFCQVSIGAPIQTKTELTETQQQEEHHQFRKTISHAFSFGKNDSIEMFTYDYQRMHKEIKLLFEELDQKAIGTIVTNFLEIPSPLQPAEKSPMILSLDLGGGYFLGFKPKQMTLKSKNKQIDFSKKKDLEIFPIPFKDGNHFFGLPYDPGFGVFNKGMLYVFQLEKECEEFVENLKKKKSVTFDAPVEELKNYGIGFFNRPDPKYLSKNFTVNYPPFKGATDLESAFLKKVLKTRVNHILFGLRYHPSSKTLAGKTRISVNLKGLGSDIDFEKANQKWQPDLGLQKENLCAAASVNYDAFKNSAAAHLVSRMSLDAFPMFGRGVQVRGTFLDNLTAIVGDSWMDCRAGRIAVYRTPAADGNSRHYNIIGIIDSKKSNAYIVKQLKEISLFTSGSLSKEEKEQRQTAVAFHISKLKSNPVEEARAETRLALGDEDVIEQLEKASKSDPSLKTKIDRIVKKIQTKQNRSNIPKNRFRDGVYSLGFWATLQPKLRFVPGKVNNHEANHFIQIQADSRKTEKEVTEASAVMEKLFGADWAKIKIEQIDDHFIFMLGSDHNLLAKTVENVKNKRAFLVSHSPKKVIAKAGGPVQAFADLEETDRLYSFLFPNAYRWQRVPQKSLCRFGLSVREKGIEAWGRLPVQQLKKFSPMR